MTRPAPRVVTIPASAPFLPTLVDALRGGRLLPGLDLGEPLALADLTLYLPTRRAGRLAEAALRAAFAPAAVLLPRIVPLGDVDEDARAGEDDAPDDGELPEAVAPMTRRLLLARLVGQLARASGGLSSAPAAVLALADELARLMDQMALARADWGKLDGLVPDALDPYWQVSARFLKVVACEAWPALLAERGAIDPMARRDRLIAREAERVARGAGGPVIAAGSTGSIPATRDLLAAIARHPRGAVVLPGLDTDLDAATWALLDPTGPHAEPVPGHPQFGLAQLLATIGIARDEVTALAPAAPHGRERLVSEALRPAASTHVWAAAALPAADVAAALDGVALVAAADPQEEALVAALALREALEHDGRTVALVTPDRALARRVAGELTRWGLAVDDSAGVPLADTPAGLFARLVAEAAAEAFAPVPLAALLKHPAIRLGLPPARLARAVSSLEIAVLRGPRPREGLAGLAAALDQIVRDRDTLHPRDPRRAGWDAAAARDLVRRLAAALSPLEAVAGEAPLADLVAAHRAALAALAGAADGGGALAGADAELLEATFDALAAAARDAAPLSLADYAELVPVLLRGAALRPPFDEAARVRILGPLEVRLVPLDRVVLSGLVEGVWPPETSTDPWLSRPMRRTLGLDLPERRIGLAAHDFAQAMGAREVVLTMAQKVGGAPAVPARFLQRLAAVAGDGWRAVEARGARWRELARTLEVAAPVPRAARPVPAPPLALRPTRLSVTEIADLVRDPYGVFARHVLRLVPLDALDADVGAAERGTLVHDALAAFLEAHPRELPGDALAVLLDHGRAAFAAIDAFPQQRALWWPRFERIARWFVAEERRRRAAAPVTSLVERRAEMAVPGTALVLSGRADRLDLDARGRVTIVDYKTGTPPTAKQVTRTPFAPQLPLEAALVAAGAFAGLPAGAAPAALAYVRLSGGEPAGEWQPRDPQDGDVAALAARALAMLAELARRFADPAQGYASLVVPQYAGRHGDYDHLARVAEWSAADGAEAEE